MPLEKLSKAELARLRGTATPARGPNPEYVRFLKRMKPGEIGRATVTKEQATKQTIKNRLNRAAKELGINIRFLRVGGNEEIRFELTDK